MARQALKDSKHNIIGYIEDGTGGTLVGRDAKFNIKGYYDPKYNKTKDHKFNIVGTGNLLAMLITSK